MTTPPLTEEELDDYERQFNGIEQYGQSVTMTLAEARTFLAAARRWLPLPPPPESEEGNGQRGTSSNPDLRTDLGSVGDMASQSVAEKRAFGASEAACINYPEDTPEHRLARQAYMRGAADTQPTEAQEWECPVCRTPLKHASGIGPYCPNSACPVLDNDLLYRKPQPTEAIAEEVEKAVAQIKAGDYELVPEDIDAAPTVEAQEGECDHAWQRIPPPAFLCPKCWSIKMEGSVCRAPQPTEAIADNVAISASRHADLNCEPSGKPQINDPEPVAAEISNGLQPQPRTEAIAEEGNGLHPTGDNRSDFIRGDSVGKPLAPTPSPDAIAGMPEPVDPGPEFNAGGDGWPRPYAIEGLVEKLRGDGCEIDGEGRIFVLRESCRLAAAALTRLSGYERCWEEQRETITELSNRMAEKDRTLWRCDRARIDALNELTRLSGEVERLKGDLWNMAVRKDKTESALTEAQSQLASLSGEVERLRWELYGCNKSDAQAALEEVQSQLAVCREALEPLVAWWDSLSRGWHSASETQEWLSSLKIETMDKARAALATIKRDEA